VISALASLRKGGVVAINAIHVDQMPAFDYDKLLWGERQIRSVANMSRTDADDLIQLIDELDYRLPLFHSSYEMRGMVMNASRVRT